MPIVQRCAWPVSVSVQCMATALRVRAYVVHSLLTDAFDGKTLHSEVDPDQAVAHGTAVQVGPISDPHPKYESSRSAAVH
jgi:molecular chaperone DnaK (HSP70)